MNAAPHTSIVFHGIEVTAGKTDRLWYVEAEGKSVTSDSLDQALSVVLPQLSYQDHDSLLIRLLLATTTDPAQER